MKKIVISFILILSCSFPSLTAQSPIPKNKETEKIKEEKPEIFRDRLIVDVFHSFWMGMPSEVEHLKFDPGFNISALWDFKVSKKSPISFGIGLGVSYYSQFTNALLKVENGPWTMRYYVLNSSIDYSLNRLNYVNCNLPVEFRYRHSSGFKFTIGARVGLVAEISQTYKGLNPDGTDEQIWRKSYEIYNKQKYNFDVYARIGWKFVNVYYSFQITKMFQEGKGPQIYPMSLGISLSIF
ncbi:MAG: hypothetical protein RR356_05305 [Bacteroidales bacterium]